MSTTDNIADAVEAYLARTADSTAALAHLKSRTLRAAADAIEAAELLGIDAQEAAAYAREFRAAAETGDYSGLEETAFADLGLELDQADRDDNDALFNALREVQVDIVAVVKA